MLFIVTTAYAKAEELFEDKQIQIKSDKAKKISLDAVAAIKKEGIDKACKSFVSDMKWRNGEIFPWVFDEQGICYCRGLERDCLWKKFGDDKAEQPFIKRMIEAGKMGGFVDYKWEHGYSRAFVKNVEWNGKNFIVGSGFYPASAVYIVKELVSSAVNYLKKNTFIELKERISNPTGIFVRGDIHLELYSFDGTCVAHGEQLAFIGQNLIDSITADGKYMVRDAIEIAKTQGEGWYNFIGQDGNEPARIFVKKIVDREDNNKPYVLICGYYTDITDETVMNLVRDAANYLKANGREIAFREFSTKNANFVRGNVNVFVYDMKGFMVADSKNPAFVGLNLANTRDSEGRFVARQIIEMARKFGRGWVTNALSNSYQVAYCEMVKVPDGDFVIGAAYFPVSKENYVQFMIEDAVLFLKNHSLEDSLLRFVTKDGGFVRGDMSVFVYTTQGICLADGTNLQKIWASDLDAKDAKGARVIDRIIAQAKSGGGWLKFNLNNGVCNVYVKAVDKEISKGKSETYIVGSGYYE